MTSIKRALISCTDKTGIAELAQFLSNRKIEILCRFFIQRNVADADKRINNAAGFFHAVDTALQFINGYGKPDILRSARHRRIYPNHFAFQV